MSSVYSEVEEAAVTGDEGSATRPITLAITGDLMLGRHVNDVIRQRGYAYPWGALLPTLHDVDLFLVNLECAITSETARWFNGSYKPFHFRADRAAVEALRVGRVDFAALANNHIGDFGREGLLETVAVLEQAGIAHAGAGENLTEALAPARLDALGARVAVVAFADYPEKWAADRSSPGMAYVPVSVLDNFAPVAVALEQARRDADLVVISVHWGPNFEERPPLHFRDFAYQALECGADVFWGHSAHIVQGVEVHDGKLILYDTGDFVDDYAVEPNLRNDLSMLFLVRISPPFIERLELIPVHIRRCQVNPAKGASREWIVQRVQALSAELGTLLTETPSGLTVAVRPTVDFGLRTPSDCGLLAVDKTLGVLSSPVGASRGCEPAVRNPQWVRFRTNEIQDKKEPPRAIASLRPAGALFAGGCRSRFVSVRCTVGQHPYPCRTIDSGVPDFPGLQLCPAASQPARCWRTSTALPSDGVPREGIPFADFVPRTRGE